MCISLQKNLKVRSEIYILEVKRLEEKEKQINVKKLGKKQKAILQFLAENGGSLWQENIVSHFAWASKYQNYVLARLHKLEKRGLISIKTEINPETGRHKKRVYLVQ